MQVDRRRRDILVLDRALSQTDLAAISTVATSAEFESQDLIRGAFTARQRAAVESPQIADLIWDAIAPHLGRPAEWFGGPGMPRLDPPIDEWSFLGCNPRSRFYSYSMGGTFSEHEDEPWRPDSSRRSLLTLLAYLPTGGCVGGETVIDGETIAVEPGRIVLFDHGLLHEGKPVERGTKLVLRNDVVAGSPTTVMDELVRETERLGLYEDDR
jgi:hypothetical protein